MLTNIVPAKWVTLTERNLVFDDGAGNGFWFPCDERGDVLPGLSDCGKKNLAEALRHPEEYSRFNEVVTNYRTVKDNAHGICRCGTDVELYDQYMGACQCPNCGQWYNLSGRELLPPEQWEEPMELDW